MNNMQKVQIKRIFTIIGIFVIIILIGIPISIGFYLSTESHIALREAKNARLALEMVAVENYGRTIYDPVSAGGMADGVWQRISNLVEEDAELQLTGYDAQNRRITGMTYTHNHFRVVYKLSESGKNSWEVNYLLKVQNYSEE